MKLIRPPSPRRGISLVETFISIVVSGFIFAFTGFLLFMVTRNAYNLNAQIQTQTSASAASERIATLLRQSSRFDVYPGDSPVSGAFYSNVMFTVPGAGQSVTTQALSFDSTARRILHYENAADLGGTPTRIYSGVTDFAVQFETEYRVRLRLGFQYSGFALMNSEAARTQFGQFVTDVIAKNHPISSGNTSHADSDSTSPELLY